MTFGIRGNTTKPGIAKVVYELSKELDKKRISYLVDSQIAALIKAEYKRIIPVKKNANGAQLVKQSDFMVSIGGDGTFLATAKLVGRRGIPIIGVNMGKLGFLAETSIGHTAKFILDITKGRFNIEERTVIQAKAKGSDKTIYGMNEIVINQSGIVKTIEIQVLYNNQLVSIYHADGIIGYSLSAGGPIVYPKTNVFILTAVAPHTLTSRPVVLPDSGVFKIRVKSRIPINAVADGASSINLNLPAEIEIKKAPYTMKLAKSLNSNYFKVLTTKLLWGIDRRKNK
jgi:NAD+ kinase